MEKRVDLYLRILGEINGPSRGLISCAGFYQGKIFVFSCAPHNFSRQIEREFRRNELSNYQVNFDDSFEVKGSRSYRGRIPNENERDYLRKMLEDHFGNT